MNEKTATSLAAEVDTLRHRIRELEAIIAGRRRGEETPADIPVERFGALNPLFRSMTEMVVLHELIFDTDGAPVSYRVVDCNQAFADDMGIEREALIGQEATAVYGTPTPPFFGEYCRVAAGGTPTHFENILPSADRCLSISVLSPGNHRFVTISSDITQQKRQEAALKESEQKLYNAVSIAKLGPWELDIASGIFTFTDAFYALFRTSAEAEGGYRMNIADYAGRFVYPEDGPLVATETRKAIDTDDPDFNRYVEHRVLFADGTIGHIAVRFFIVKDAAGKTIKTYGVNQDITDRKQAEQERAKLNEQLVQARKMESVGRLAGGVAHDFNNMLEVMLGNTELALDFVDKNSPAAECLEEIRIAAEHSADLTKQLLAFARRQTILPKVLDLNETVAGMLNMLRRLVGENVEIVWEPGFGVRPVHMDPMQIHQVLANLCVNARDAIADVGHITITTDDYRVDGTPSKNPGGTTQGDYTVLSVTDSGCGMDAEIVANLFEPFFTTKELGRGTGLGLSTVHGIVKQNNGFIDVVSEKGVGTTFRILLPVYARSASAGAINTEAGLEIRGNETVLLVEDEPAVLRLGKRMLEALGYKVLTAARPSEALRVVQEHGDEIDLLATDVIMPEMNGRELASKIQTLHPGVGCLLMSGHPADVIGRRDAVFESIHFIQKPFSREALSVAIRKALEER